MEVGCADYVQIRICEIAARASPASSVCSVCSVWRSQSKPIEEEAEEVCVLFSIHGKTGFQFCSDKRLNYLPSVFAVRWALGAIMYGHWGEGLAAISHILI